ncbi:MAG: hypothetical protein V4669_14920 [Pseudomonadota bacterium]
MRPPPAEVTEGAASRAPPAGPMQIRIVRQKDFMGLEATGALDLDTLLEVIAKLGTLTRQSGEQRVLFDLLNLDGQPHVAGQMQVGDQIGKCLAHVQRVASAVPIDRITHASENVARTHGVTMKVFGDRHTAIAWLREGSTPEEAAAPPARTSSLDPARAAIWAAVRHLFPPHAQAIQLPTGTLAISWPISKQQHRDARYEMATPITVRLEPDLLESLNVATAEQRKRIASNQEAAFRAGMIGYDPYTAVPKARVIVLG